MASRGPEEIECDVALQEEAVPFFDREGGVQAGDAGEEMVLPGLDGSFSGIAAMDVGWHEFELDLVFAEGFAEIFGAFIVQDVEAWGVSIVSEFEEQLSPGLGEFCGLSSFGRPGKDKVSVVIIHDHDVLVASGGDVWKFACLIAV